MVRVFLPMYLPMYFFVYYLILIPPKWIAVDDSLQVFCMEQRHWYKKSIFGCIFTRGRLMQLGSRLVASSPRLLTWGREADFWQLCQRLTTSRRKVNPLGKWCLFADPRWRSCFWWMNFWRKLSNELCWTLKIVLRFAMQLELQESWNMLKPATKWFKNTFWSLTWRSLNLWNGHT